MIYTETAVCLSGFVRGREKEHKKSFPAKILKTDISTEKPLFLFIHRTDQIVSQETKYLITSEQNVNRML